MNNQIMRQIFGGITIIALSFPVLAVEPNSAKVISVKPNLVTKSVPVRVCRDVPRTVYYERGPSGVGTVLGGVAGGVIGSQIGGGTGRTIATIGGAALGATAGSQIGRGTYARTGYVTVCKTKQVKKSIQNGYVVTYSYDGKQQTQIMKKKPVGDTIPVKYVPE